MVQLYNGTVFTNKTEWWRHAYNVCKPAKEAGHKGQRLVMPFMGSAQNRQIYRERVSGCQGLGEACRGGVDLGSRERLGE